MSGEQYDADYFLRGRQSGKSLYEDYRWLPELTVPMVARMISHLGIEPSDVVLDFGCARGYTVRAFRSMGYNAWGCDVSQWALQNCDEIVKDYLNHTSLMSFDKMYDWVIAKDVLEHVPNVVDVIVGLLESACVGVFAVVPLSYADGDSYVVEEYEKDITHIHRLTLATWARMFMRPGWSVTASYRVPGVKDNYAKYECGNGFIMARRLEPIRAIKAIVPPDVYQEVID